MNSATVGSGVAGGTVGLTTVAVAGGIAVEVFVGTGVAEGAIVGISVPDAQEARRNKMMGKSFFTGAIICHWADGDAKHHHP